MRNTTLGLFLLFKYTQKVRNSRGELYRDYNKFDNAHDHASATAVIYAPGYSDNIKWNKEEGKGKTVNKCN